MRPARNWPDISTTDSSAGRQDLIAREIERHFDDPQAFFARVSYLNDTKIHWPWDEDTKGHQEHVPRHEIAIAEELLIEINNLVHFGEPVVKIRALMQLAKEHFAIAYSSHPLSVSLYNIEIVDRTFLIVATTPMHPEAWCCLFASSPGTGRHFMSTFDEKSWWYEEEPTQGRDWWHAPYDPNSLQHQATVETDLLGKAFVFITSLERETQVRLGDPPPGILRHTGRIDAHRTDGWYLRVLEEMERCGNYNAKHALERAWG
jgi:hypothetical protein